MVQLGYTQTPTLNASISGNISLATRRANIASSDNDKINDEGNKNDLDLRIAKLKAVKDVLTNDHLENVLNIITEQFVFDFKEINSLKFDISVGAKISANDIPEEMHSFIVNFSKKTGIQPKHFLERYEEEYDDPFSIISPLYLQKKKRKISYFVAQPKDMPPSGTIIELKGDGRCLPDVKILIYIIPLQITGCMLVSAFNCGWKEDLSGLKLIKNYYQILKPDDSIERIKEIGPFATRDSIEKINKIVQKRVDLLERELSE